MPGLPVGTQANSGSLALGVQRNFWATYERDQTLANTGRLSRIVEEAPAVSDQVKFAYFESAPIPGFFGRGRTVASKSFKDVGWSVSVYEWAGKVEWRFQDAQDDQTSSLEARARETGAGFWVRDESNFFQILNAGTDQTGLPAVPNCADGAAFFSATDGASANRFGVSGGNIVTGKNFGSGSGVRSAYQSGLSRMFQFQDTESQPLMNPGAKNFMVIGAAADLEAYNEAFKQQFVAQAAVTATSNAGVSNVIMDAGYNVELWLTQRVSTGVMFVFNTDVPVKPLVRVKRQDPQESVQNMTNSDIARLTGIEGVQWISRTGYGCSLPYGAVKVTT